MTNDRDLIHKIQQGDPDACDALYRQHENGLRWHVRSLVRDEAAADDLLQETFLRLWIRAGQWRGAGSVKAWLYSIARNLALTHLDSVRRRRQQPLEMPDDEDEDTLVPAWMID